MILWDLPLNELLQAWDEYDKRGTDIAGIRALCLEDRYYLLVKMLKRVDMLHPWVYQRCREVERSPDDHLDLWAREHFKSSIITVGGVIQEILRDREITVGLFSHVKPISKSFLAQIKREFEFNQDLKAAFPDVLYANPERESPSWSLDAGIIVRRETNPKEATVEAHGLVDGQPTAKHFRLRVYDDVVTLESVSTPEQVQKTTSAWELSDNLGTQDGRKWHIGTRYNFGDTWQEILNRGVVTPRIYPATHDGTETGIPVLLTPEQWEAKKITQGPATIACQMLQNPIAGQQRMFDITDLQVYEVRPETLAVYLLVDPARSKKKGSAHTAMVVVGFDYAGNKYLLDGYDHKMDLQERWARLRDLWVRWKQAPGVQGVNVGYEKYGAIADLDYFEEQRKLERLPITIETLEWPADGEGSKVDRVQRLGPDMRQHKIYVPHPTHPDRMTRNQRDMTEAGYGYRVSQAIRRKDGEGNIYDLTERFKMQLAYFPFGGLKDIVDAFSRIYDMEPKAPMIYEKSAMEPEWT